MAFDPKSALKELKKPGEFDPASALSELDVSHETIPDSFATTPVPETTKRILPFMAPSDMPLGEKQALESRKREARKRGLKGLDFEKFVFGEHDPSLDIEGIPSFQIPRIPAETAVPGRKADVATMNLLLGLAELGINFPLFPAQIAEAGQAPVGEPTMLDIISPKTGELQIPEIAKSLVTPAAKLAAGIRTKEETQAGRELFEEAVKESIEHPEGLALPFLLALGGGKAVGRKLPGKARGVKPTAVTERITKPPEVKVPFAEELAGVKLKGVKGEAITRKSVAQLRVESQRLREKSFNKNIKPEELRSILEKIKQIDNEIIVRPAEELAGVKPKVKPAVKGTKPITMKDIFSESVKELRSRVSNVRYGPIKGNKGTILFDYEGKIYSAPEPTDVLPVGAGEASKAWGLKQLLNDNATVVGKIKPKPKPKAPKPQALEVPRKLGVSIERELKTAKGEIDVKTKPQDIQGITDKLSKNLGVPIRVGKFRKVTAFGKVKRAGIFKPDAKVARTGSADDLPTITHEVAHFIDDKFKVQRLIKKDKAFVDELSQLDYDPTKGRTTEGFAEFVRLWMTDDVAAEVAPKFNKKFGEFLAENPDLKKTLESARDDIFRFRKQGAEARVRSSLTLQGQKDFGGLADAYLKARTAFSDALAPLRELDIQAEKIVGRKIPPAESAFQTATAINKTAPMKARQWAEVATADFDGNPTGLSMKAILEPVKGKELKAIEYAFSKHALERWDKGKNPGVARIDAKAFIEKNRSPKFETFSKELSAYRDRLLQYVVDSGGLSEETANIFREYYKSSIPLYRTGFAGRGIGGGKGFADLGKPIKGAKGSGRRVINPLAGLLSETERLISWADRARIGQLIVDTAEKAGGLGKWVEKVDIPAKPKKVLIEDIKAQFEKMGGDLTELNLDDFNKYMTFWTSEARGIPKENIVTFYRDGKLQAFQLHPELFKAVKSVDQVILPTWLRLFTFPKKLITAGATGLRASFGLGTNAIRDPMTYFMQSENPAATPFKPLIGDYVQARSKLGLLLKYDTPKEARLWMQQGGEMAMFFNSELPKAMKTAQSMIREGRTPAGWTKETLKGIGTVYRETINVPEAGARITEFTDIYNKTLKETGSRRSAWIAGQIAAKDVTINFTRMGNIVALANQFIPFMNPAIQGIGKLGRTFKANPMRTVARGSVLTAATLSLWWKNRNEDWYQALPAWDKYGFWHFKVDNTIWRLPRPFEWGYIFAGIPEGAAESMMQNNPDEFKKSMGEALENALPPLMPGFLGPSLQVGIGEGGFDFFRDRPIVPQSQVERLAPSERAGRFTTETAKNIGRVLNVSPRKVDFWISAQTGGMGQDIIRFVESISRPGLSARTISDIPFIGRFTSRTPFVGKLYEELRDARKKEINLPGATRKEKARGGDKARAVVVKAKQLERVAKQLALWRKAIDGIEQDKTLSVKDRKEKVQELELKMEQRAKKAIFGDGGNQ